MDVKALTTDLAKLLADHRQRTHRLRTEAKRQAEAEAARRQVSAAGILCRLAVPRSVAVTYLLHPWPHSHSGDSSRSCRMRC